MLWSIVIEKSGDFYYPVMVRDDGAYLEHVSLSLDLEFYGIKRFPENRYPTFASLIRSKLRGITRFSETEISNYKLGQSKL